MTIIGLSNLNNGETALIINDGYCHNSCSGVSIVAVHGVVVVVAVRGDGVMAAVRGGGVVAVLIGGNIVVVVRGGGIVAVVRGSDVIVPNCVPIVFAIRLSQSGQKHDKQWQWCKVKLAITDTKMSIHVITVPTF